MCEDFVETTVRTRVLTVLAGEYWRVMSTMHVYSLATYLQVYSHDHRDLCPKKISQRISKRKALIRRNLQARAYKRLQDKQIVLHCVDTKAATYPKLYIPNSCAFPHLATDL